MADRKSHQASILQRLPDYDEENGLVVGFQRTRRPVLPIHNKEEEDLITTNAKGLSEPD
ncbi:hypothetical protein GYMLUDRAFT_94465 [Collybiopsis luxurians FD-317 M1]|nr:hypothetical protein GYMLUDRAFT_94465 [Collybiopsis luxurians FD-317 M1]